MSRLEKTKRFITRFDTTACKSQELNIFHDLMDEEGFLPFHLRVNRIKVATAMHKAYSNGLNEGYKNYLQNLDSVESDPSIIEELSIARYDDLQLQQAFVRGYENARAYVSPENYGSNSSENFQTSNAGVTDSSGDTAINQTES